MGLWPRRNEKARKSLLCVLGGLVANIQTLTCFLPPVEENIFLLLWKQRESQDESAAAAARPFCVLPRRLSGDGARTSGEAVASPVCSWTTGPSEVPVCGLLVSMTTSALQRLADLHRYPKKGKMPGTCGDAVEILGSISDDSKAPQRLHVPCL